MMNRVLALALVSLLARQDEPTIHPGEPSADRWPISGTAAFEDGEELYARARRVVRRWDFSRKLFTESQVETSLRAIGVVSGRKYTAKLPSGVPGRYALTLSTEEKILASGKFALGTLEAQFSRTVDDLKTILDVSERAVGFFDEIERILLGQAGNAEKDRVAYMARVNDQARRVRELYERIDLTGTLEALRELYYHIANVQVWAEKPLPPPAMDDPPRTKKHVFTDMDMNIDKLRKMQSVIPDVLAWEIKVSTTFNLEALFGQSADVERRKESARGAARAASKLAGAAPTPDADLIKLLEQAADAESDPAVIRPLLREAGQVHVVR